MKNKIFKRIPVCQERLLKRRPRMNEHALPRVLPNEEELQTNKNTLEVPHWSFPAGRPQNVSRKGALVSKNNVVELPNWSSNLSPFSPSYSLFYMNSPIENTITFPKGVLPRVYRQGKIQICSVSHRCKKSYLENEAKTDVHTETSRITLKLPKPPPYKPVFLAPPILNQDKNFEVFNSKVADKLSNNNCLLEGKKTLFFRDNQSQECSSCTIKIRVQPPLEEHEQDTGTRKLQWSDKSASTTDPFEVQNNLAAADSYLETAFFHRTETHQVAIGKDANTRYKCPKHQQPSTVKRPRRKNAQLSSSINSQLAQADPCHIHSVLAKSEQHKDNKDDDNPGKPRVTTKPDVVERKKASTETVQPNTTKQRKQAKRPQRSKRKESSNTNGSEVNQREDTSSSASPHSGYLSCQIQTSSQRDKRRNPQSNLAIFAGCQGSQQQVFVPHPPYGRSAATAQTIMARRRRFKSRRSGLCDSEASSDRDMMKIRSLAKRFGEEHLHEINESETVFLN